MKLGVLNKTEMAGIPSSVLECLEAIYRLSPEGTAVSLDSLGKKLALNKALVTEKFLGRLPSGDGVLRTEAAVPLHRLKPGKGGTISRIEKEEPELLKYLASLGLLPQTKVEVEEVAPFGGPVLVRVGTSRYALGRKVASKIFVREA